MMRRPRVCDLASCATCGTQLPDQAVPTVYPQGDVLAYAQRRAKLTGRRQVVRLGDIGRGLRWLVQESR